MPAFRSTFKTFSASLELKLNVKDIYIFKYLFEEYLPDKKDAQFGFLIGGGLPREFGGRNVRQFFDKNLLQTENVLNSNICPGVLC